MPPRRPRPAERYASPASISEGGANVRLVTGARSGGPEVPSGMLVKTAPGVRGPDLSGMRVAAKPSAGLRPKPAQRPTPSGEVVLEASPSEESKAAADAGAQPPVDAADPAIVRKVLVKLGVPQDRIDAMTDDQAAAATAISVAVRTGQMTLEAAAAEVARVFGAGSPSANESDPPGSTCASLPPPVVAALRRDPGQVCVGQVVPAADGSNWRVERGADGELMVRMVDGGGGGGIACAPGSSDPACRPAQQQAESAAMWRGVGYAVVGVAALAALAYLIHVNTRPADPSQRASSRRRDEP